MTPLRRLRHALLLVAIVLVSGCGRASTAPVQVESLPKTLPPTGVQINDADVLRPLAPTAGLISKREAIDRARQADGYHRGRAHALLVKWSVPIPVVPPGEKSPFPKIKNRPSWFITFKLRKPIPSAGQFCPTDGESCGGIITATRVIVIVNATTGRLVDDFLG